MFVHQVNDEISLRLVDLGDVGELFKLTDESREHLRAWLPWLDRTKTQKDTEEYIKFSKKLYAENKGMNTIVLYKGDMAGVAGFNEIDWDNRIAYIGYWLGEQYTGKGIMTRVAGALTDYAFNGLGMNKVDIRAAEFNIGSRAIPERLGFKQEGRIRSSEFLYDHYVDHIVYGMLKDEWKGYEL
ncbi:GNAT family N-acetyltransferase [Aquisalibacillus elongatus]|uniref:Ribosomal-protein-serine acetyltransferase n=1 Tax=Aquisalibacillus elongatus TaxID=485577 RepID=A0A3N5B9L8_9BACI|nr:GNAT family protein [Aquisalibacillus elongatus]RPF54093.1 ribosomal-protein-serine acetyltransferase [Aquisalibacillus elongatus]